MENKFRNLGGEKKSISPSNTLQVIKTSKGIVDFTPTFEENDIVCIKPKFHKYSSELTKLSKFAFVVDCCKVVELGDMVIEVLYLNEHKDLITNPYLPEHFEKV